MSTECEAILPRICGLEAATAPFGDAAHPSRHIFTLCVGFAMLQHTAPGYIRWRQRPKID